MENIQQYTFRSLYTANLYYYKKEIFQQMQDLQIYFTAKGFFNVDRKQLAAVRLEIM